MITAFFLEFKTTFADKFFFDFLQFDIILYTDKKTIRYPNATNSKCIKTLNTKNKTAVQQILKQTNITKKFTFDVVDRSN